MRSRSLVLGVLTLVAVGCKSPGTTSNYNGPSPLSVTAFASAEVGLPPLAVEFTSLVSGGVGPFDLQWDLGDGTLADGDGVNHLYDTLGNYLVELRVVDARGVEATSTVVIIAGDPDVPLIAAVAEPSVGYAPLTVEFHADFGGGIGPHDVLWTFGDGGVDPTATTTHTYNIPGNYVATFTVVDADGDENLFGVPIVVTTDETPAVTVTADKTNGEAPLTVQFTSEVLGGNGELAYTWDFGDGNASTDPNPQHTFTENNGYTVTLTVADVDGDEGSAFENIVVAPLTATMPELVIAGMGATLQRDVDSFESNDTRTSAFYAGNTDNLPSYPGPYIHPTGLTYYIDVTNLGLDITSPFSVGLYHGATSEPGVGTSPTHSVTVSALARNETRRVYITVPDLGVGSVTSWALADPFGTVDEASEANNTRDTTQTVTADEDWFKIYHPNTDPIDVILTDLAGDYDLYVYGPNGYYGSSTNGGTADEGGTVYPDASGYWYFGVISPAGDASATKPYTLWFYPY